MKKYAVIVALLLAIAVPVAAQTPPPPEGPQPEQVLKEVLGLSAEQLGSLRDLAQTRASAAETLRRQVEERQRGLNEALSGTSPDPSTVGALVVSINSLQKQFGQIEESFHNGFRLLLTEEQKSKLAFIRSVEAAIKATGALYRLGL